MSSQAETLDELIRRLPPDSQGEVRDFVESLLKRHEASAPSDARPQKSLRDYFGAWDSGDEHSADNERIDADLAREYASTHEGQG
jgi:hypothetical protein